MEHRVRRGSLEDLPRVAPLFDAYRVFYGKQPDLATSRQFLADRLSQNEFGSATVRGYGLEA